MAPFFGSRGVPSQICSWCEVVTPQHMHIHIHTYTRLSLAASGCLKDQKKHSQSAREIIGNPCSKPLPCSRPHAGKDTAPTGSQRCTPDVPPCTGKCDPSLCATCSSHLLYNHAQNLNRLQRQKRGKLERGPGRRENKQKTECLGGKEGDGGREALAECLGGV